MNAVNEPFSAPDPRVQPGAAVVAVSGRYTGRRHSADAVLGSLAALSDLQRRTVVMTYYRRMSGHHVADALSIDSATVYAHLHDALTAMKCQLGG